MRGGPLLGLGDEKGAGPFFVFVHDRPGLSRLIVDDR